MFKFLKGLFKSEFYRIVDTSYVIKTLVGISGRVNYNFGEVKPLILKKNSFWFRKISYFEYYYTPNTTETRVYYFYSNLTYNNKPRTSFIAFWYDIIYCIYIQYIRYGIYWGWILFLSIVYSDYSGLESYPLRIK
jgi:hypothetical protein